MTSEEDTRLKDVASCMLGYGLCMLGVLGYTCATGFAQALSGYIPIFELNTSRYIAQVTVTSLVLTCMRTPPSESRRQFAWTAVAGISLWAGNVALYQGALYLPAGTLAGVDNSMMAFVGMVSSVVATRSCRRSVLVPFLICVAGLIMVSQPKLLGFEQETVSIESYNNPCEKYSNSSKGHTTQSVIGDTAILGYGLAAISGISRGVGIVASYYRLADVHWMVTSFWLGLFGLISSIGVSAPVEKLRLPSNPVCWGLFVGHTLPLAVASIFINYSSLLIPPFALTILLTTEIINMTILQYTSLKHIHPGHRNWEEVVGILLLTVGNCSVALLGLLEVKGAEKANYEDISDHKSGK